jgi:hypothetical protein
MEFTKIFECLLDNIPGAWIRRMAKRLEFAEYAVSRPVRHNREVNKLVSLASIHSEIRDKFWNRILRPMGARELLAALTKASVWAAPTLIA